MRCKNTFWRKAWIKFCVGDINKKALIIIGHAIHLFLSRWTVCYIWRCVLAPRSANQAEYTADWKHSRKMWLVSVIVALIAIRQRIGVRVVEQTVVSISPGKSLSADTQVRVWHKFWLLMWVGLGLHVGVCHADTNARKGQHNGEYLPCLCSPLMARMWSSRKHPACC